MEVEHDAVGSKTLQIEVDTFSQMAGCQQKQPMPMSRRQAAWKAADGLDASTGQRVADASINTTLIAEEVDT